MDLTIGLVVLVLGLFGWLLYERSKKQSAEALNSNLDTKQQVLDVQKDVEKNNGLIEAEKQKQDDLNKKLEEEKAKDVSKDDLLDFFNKSDK